MLASCNVMQYSSLQCNILKTKSCLFHYSTILLLRVLAFPFYTLFWKPAMEVHQKWHSSIFKTAVVKLWYKSPTTKMVHTSVHVCKRKKTHVASNYACTRMQNKCTTHTHLSIRNIYHETILLTTSSDLSFIIYACRNILGGMVSDILGHLGHTAFVAPCSYS